jgi:hypothetical protein
MMAWPCLSFAVSMRSIEMMAWPCLSFAVSHGHGMGGPRIKKWVFKIKKNIQDK